MHSSDLQLLLDTHRGRQPAAERLWARFAPVMIAYARAIVGQSDAADVVQVVFLSLLRQPRRSLRRIQDVQGWLLSLTRNAALNHLRTRRRERLRSANHAPASPATDSDHSNDDLTAAIERLPRRDRELLILKHIAGLTFDQIALALDTNRNTAAGRYRSALQKLRSHMIEAPERLSAEVCP